MLAHGLLIPLSWVSHRHLIDISWTSHGHLIDISYSKGMCDRSHILALRLGTFFFVFQKKTVILRPKSVRNGFRTGNFQSVGTTLG